MCGFVGVVSFSGDLPDPALLSQMRDTLAHRGPDDVGEFRDARVVLDFRRLSILDLSPAGHQPMSNAEGSVWIVFNGEVYNYLELRKVLEASGCCFRSGTDTEVLLFLYEKHGLEMFSYLNGMFAFAIYDVKQGRVVLARDRLGLKPLYYWHFEGGVAFASELKALKPLRSFPRAINPTAASIYLRLGFVPGSTCIFPGVAKLPPAHYAVVHLDRPESLCVQRYWQMDWNVKPEDRPEKFWLDHIEELLYDATRIRLRSDVPLGAFLSGGIDSGLVAAMAARVIGTDLRTFTVSFAGWSEDEWPAARLTASHLGVTACHEVLREDSLGLLTQLAAHFDEPFADTSCLPTFLICQSMRKYATVILSGDGGDELFAGYPHYPLMWNVRHLDRMPDLLRSSLFHLLGILFPDDSWVRRNSLRLALTAGGGWSAWYSKNVFEDWQTRVLKPQYQISAVDLVTQVGPSIGLGKGRTSLDRSQYADLNLMLPDDFLVKLDRMSMLASVEVRSPFLDYRFTELVSRIPPGLRVKKSNTKYLLRQLSKRYLPREVLDIPKHGFGIPTAEWVNSLQADWLLTRASACAGEFVPYTPEGILWLREQTKSSPFLVGPLFRLLMFFLWLEGNIDMSCAG
jgi:asparagine synthase (glutamine-hydrolysing)